MSDPKAGIPFSIIIRTTFPSNFLRNKSAPLNQFYSMFLRTSIKWGGITITIWGGITISKGNRRDPRKTNWGFIV